MGWNEVKNNKQWKNIIEGAIDNPKDVANKKPKLEIATAKAPLLIIISCGFFEKILAVAHGIIIKAVIKKTPVTFTAKAINSDNKIKNKLFKLFIFIFFTIAISWFSKPIKNFFRYKVIKIMIKTVRIKIVRKWKLFMLAMSPNKNSSKTKFLLKFSLNKTAQDIKK